jgi:hypothetical protein
MPSSSASITVSKLSQPVLFRADENMNFITSARPVIYNALMKDGNKYVNATITLHDDDGTGTDEIKI